MSAARRRGAPALGALLGAAALACGEAELAAFATDPATTGGSAGASGGSAGTGAASGGSAGTAGAAPSGLIDDFEDGNIQPIGDDGWWYSLGDDGRMPLWAVQPSLDRAGSRFALHVSDEGYVDWSFLGVDLPGGVFDASAFTTVRFWARAEQNSVRELSVQMLDANGKALHDLAITTTWQEYVIPLREFLAADGSNRVLDPTSVSHLQFFVFSPARFDYWLDDVSFR